jgi:putative ABC transport system ATP-binding protein
MTILQARHIEKAFGRTHALRGVSVRIEPGEIVAITGPSGSGKSTLLHCLSGIMRPETGEVHYDGQRIDTLDETAPGFAGSTSASSSSSGGSFRS